jgi:hypothetical protein
MATTVPATDPAPQFLFIASISSRLISGFRINNDGSLAPVSGSPFVTGAPARAIAGLQNALIVGDETGIKAFSVDKATGTIQQTDAITPGEKLMVRVVEGKLQTLPALSSPSSTEARAAPPAVLDASGKFMYIVDSSQGELLAFRVEAQKLFPLSPPSYPLPGGSASITLVKP